MLFFCVSESNWKDFTVSCCHHSRESQLELCEFEARWVYTVRSRLTGTSQWPCLKERTKFLALCNGGNSAVKLPPNTQRHWNDEYLLLRWGLCKRGMSYMSKPAIMETISWYADLKRISENVKKKSKPKTEECLPMGNRARRMWEHFCNISCDWKKNSIENSN